MALFTVAEARAFKLRGETPLSSAATYPDATIEAAEARINERFTEVCDLAFEPTSRTLVLDGKGSKDLLVPNIKVTAVTAASIDGVTVDVDDLKVYTSGIIRYPDGIWTKGDKNVSVTYTHGSPSVPHSIKWAALVVCVEELTGSDITNRAVSQTDELGTFRLSTPDGKNRHYGIPSVDSILVEYAADLPGFA